ncbi:putative HTH-type transcriptional regulator [Mycolicibacterium duvalii]|uniref:Putative HTH-type transcriptional regulator n=1 Tax=Mycolicibacterium duvalii TaxID=39688 RepID=A0A7I7JX97_9MYCO|nr:putative HTH-type transcriptional regulator [Mycolicibacterium duvalii]
MVTQNKSTDLYSCDTEPVGRRQDARDRTERRIVELGRRQLADVGAAGLSLRAIARDLGLVSSAVYRYVASRDDLLTLLLVDAYTELAETVDRAAGDAGDHWRTQLRAMSRALRGWAVDHRAEWALLYGSPVPGYRAPRDRTVGPGTRVIGALLAAVSAGAATGEVTGGPPVDLSPTLTADLAALRTEFGVSVGDAALVKSLLLWAALIGAVNLEVFGHYGPDTFTGPAEVFDVQVELLLDMLAQN